MSEGACNDGATLFIMIYLFACIVHLMAFLLHVTGNVVVFTISIQVEILDESEAITAHTCLSLIVFPRGAFTDSFEYYFVGSDI